MKKFFASVGLVAAGTASLYAAYTPDLTPMQASKFWTVSTTLRGFYDDNYSTSTDGHKQGSVGFEVNPEIKMDVPLQQTEIGLKYDYGLYYYQKRQDDGQNPIDQSHQLDLYVDHAFTERLTAKVDDTLAIGQEPTLLNPGGGPNAQPFRVNGNNLANNGTVLVKNDWTRQLSTVMTYRNGFYDYQNNDDGLTPAQQAADPSLAGILNRIDQTIGMDLQWQFAPETVGLIGYKFEWVNYTGNEAIAPGFNSDSRNTRSHIVYVGVQHNLLANFNVSADAGVQDVDYYNASPSTSSLQPYGTLSAVYTYAPGSYVQLGFTHEENATDVVAPKNGKITQSQESSVVFVSVNHHVTQKLLATAIVNFQNSTFNGGANANEADQTYSFGANLNYAFTQHFSAMLGYNFDDLQSDIAGRSYSRNRVYLGVTAAY